MRAGPVQTKSYGPPPLRRAEIFRYAGCRAPRPEDRALLDSCLAELEGQLVYRVCCRAFPLARQGALLDLGFLRTASADLERNLRGCSRIWLFAATLGLGLDRLIQRYSGLSPARALFFQAVGAERIEALCDLFCGELAAAAAREGLFTRPRFSPGYGDFPLEAQREIFRVLDCPRQIGLTLTESLLMRPSKSVTALVGLGPAPADCGPGGCAACGKMDCAYKRTME